MSQRYQLTCHAELDALPCLHALVERACDDHPEIGDKTRYAMMLAVDEACTNIIQHGYAGMPPGEIRLGVEVKADRVQITITDFGRAFEPASAPPPDLLSDLEERPVGGLGVYFIHKAMDEVRYKSVGGKNTLRLTKYFGR